MLSDSWVLRDLRSCPQPGRLSIVPGSLVLRLPSARMGMWMSLGGVALVLQWSWGAVGSPALLGPSVCLGLLGGVVSVSHPAQVHFITNTQYTDALTHIHANK